MDVAEARRLKALEDENTRLKRLLADAMLANAALKDAAPEANCLRATSQLGPQSPLAAREYREPEHELFPQTRGLYQPKNRFDGDAAIGASAHLTSRGGAKDTRDQRVRMISWPCRVFRTALPDTTR